MSPAPPRPEAPAPGSSPGMRGRLARASLAWPALVLVALAAGLGWLNGLGRADRLVADTLLAWHTRLVGQDVVIVAIDDRSLTALGRWPWRREVHAALLDRLAGAGPRAVGLDLILSEADDARPEDDRALAAAMRRLGTVVLPLRMTLDTAGRPQASLPAPPFAQAAAALGHIHLELDADGVAREVYLREGLPDQDWPHFALAVLGVARQTTAPTPAGERRPQASQHTPGSGPPAWMRDQRVLVPFAGPPGHFARVSYVDVLDGLVDPRALAGRIVLVGATAAGMGDAYPTPMASRDGLMPGIEISANLIDAVAQGVGLRRAQPWENAVWCAWPLLLACLALAGLRPRDSLLALLALAGTTLAGTWAMLHGAGVQLAPAGALATLAAAYPLWSWRRLEAAMSFLAEEFERTRHEGAVLPPPHHSPAVGWRGDLLDRRMQALADAAQGLRELQWFVHDSLDRLPDPALVTDASGRVRLANAAARVRLRDDPDGLPLTDALQRLGLPLADLPLAPGAAPAHAWDAEVSDDAGTAWWVKAVPRTAWGGKAVPHTAWGVEAVPRTAAQAGGDTVGWIVALVDITPVRQAERQRDEALRFMSHDLRSPLSSILTLIELERHGSPRPSHGVEAVYRRIEAHARRSLALADDFMQMARAESSDYRLETTDLNDVVIDAADQHWETSRARGIEVVCELPQAPCLVLCDRALLTRAVANLVGNALKYSPQGTPQAPRPVTCRIGRDGACWTLQVSDHGIGIDPQALATIFERFARGAGSGPMVDGRPVDGVGLGLAFVRTVARRHGGSVSAISTPGQGSTFTISLPAR